MIALQQAERYSRVKIDSQLETVYTNNTPSLEVNKLDGPAVNTLLINIHAYKFGSYIGFLCTTKDAFVIAGRNFDGRVDSCSSRYPQNASAQCLQ